MNSFKRFTMMASLLTGLLITLFVSYGSSATPAASASGPIDPLQITHDYFDQNRAEYGWVDADLSDYLVTDMYQSPETGVTHIYLRQRVNGIEVWTGNANANVMPDGSMLIAFSSFARNVDRNLYDGQPVLTAAEALNSAAQQLIWPITEYFVAEQNLSGVNQAQILSTGGIAASPISAKLVYVVGENNQLTLAWEAIVELNYTSDWWQMTIDATTGKVLGQQNWVVSENWDSFFKYNSTAANPANSTAANPASILQMASANQAEAAGGDGSSYRVFEMPVESPNHASPSAPADGRTLASQPAHSTASPFGWHDTNGVSGAEFTTTEGNNVHAYTDTDFNNTPDPGSSPDGGAGLDFDFTLDLTQAPSTYRPAAVTNLFYWNNVIHDVAYVYGFDEAAGNFQVNTYGRGGTGNDSVQAEAQDGSGTNNANFATPPDGSRPRMQMFIGTNPNPDVDGDFDNAVIAHEYGHGISNRLTGGPANVSCLGNSEQMGEGWSDWQGLIMTMNASDTATEARGIGTYLFGQPVNGPGIRPAPYSTDIAVNGFTYGDTSSLAVPHGVGFAWATMLWEMNWLLIDEYGFEPNLYNWDPSDWDNSGNTLAYYLIQEGMAIQPCSPGFVDGRNAILAADVALTGGANACLIWEAFAKRGLGFGATQGSTSSNSDNAEAFDMPPSCMTLNVVPTSQDICQGSTADYVVNVGPSYMGSVAMSATGNPAPSTTTFSPNPVITIPSTTTLTIGNTAAVTPGSYTVTITGTDGTTTDDIDVDLNVFAGAPGATTLTSPGNNSTGVAIAPTLSWSAVANATDYFVEVATDAGFTNIVYSNSVAGTSDTVSTNLSTNTQYFWRVTTDNVCGVGAVSSTFSFTTTTLYCGPGGSLPDNSSQTFTLNIANAGELTDLDVSILASHTFVGDTIFTLVHQDTGTSVTMIDRPGRTTTGFGCGNNNIDVLLDDEGTNGPVENQCATDPALFGNPTPNNPLSAFDGEDLSGTWQLQYTDAASGDTGTLTEWCVIPTLAVNDYGVEVSAAVTAQDADADTSVSYTVDITNTGALSDSYNLAAVSSEGWTVGVDQASVTLDVGESTSVEVTVDVPANAVSGTVDTTTFTATSQGNGSVSDSVDLWTTVNEPEIAVTPTELEATVTAEGTADQTLTIWNMGGSNLDWDIAEDAGRGPVGNVFSAIVRGNGSADASTAAELVGTIAETSAVAPAGKVEIFAPTDVLYDNGSLVNSPGTGPAGADESLLQDTSLGMGTFGFGHQIANNNSMADDFVIPAGENWVIDTVTFYAYQTGSTTTSTITGYNYDLYDGPPNAGGTLIFSGNTIISSVWSGIYRGLESAPGATNRPIMATTVDFGGLELGEGTYWIEWQAAGSLASGPWAPPITIAGQTSTGNGLQNQAGVWSNAMDVGQQDLPFVIEGSLASCNSDVPWLSVSPLSGTTAAGGSSDVTVTYDATGYTAGVYTGTLCVNSNDLVNPQITVPVTMTVSEAGVDIGPDAALSGMPGETVTYTIAITNTGVNADTFNLSVAGNTWVTELSETTIALGAGATGSFDVTVEVPAGAWAGDWDVATVMATSQADSNISDSAELTTTAEAVYGFEWSADTTAHEGAAGETVTYTISLTNTGNMTDTFNISLAGHSWATTSSHSSMMLAPGESADFTVSVMIDASAAHPDTDTTTLTVTSVGDGSVTDNVDLTTSVEENITPANPVIYLPMIMRP